MSSTPENATPESALGRRAPGESDGLIYSILMVIFAIIFLAPAIGVFYTSLKTDTQISEHGVWALSGNLTLDNYTAAFASDGLLAYLRNSVLVTVPAVLLSVSMGTLVGFVTAKLRPRGSAFLLGF